MAKRKFGSVKAVNDVLITSADLAQDVTGILAVANGGTGQSTFTDGQLLIGNTTGNTLAKTTLTGTANQVNVANGGGSITLSTPQNLHTGATPQFARLGLGVVADATNVLYAFGNSQFGTGTNYNEGGQASQGATALALQVASGSAGSPVSNNSPTLVVQRQDSTNNGTSVIPVQISGRKQSGNGNYYLLHSFLRQESATLTDAVALTGSILVNPATVPAANQTNWAGWFRAERLANTDGVQPGTRISGAEFDAVNSTDIDASKLSPNADATFGLNIVGTGLKKNQADQPTTTAHNTAAILVQTGNNNGKGGFWTGVLFDANTVFDYGIDFNPLGATPIAPIRMANATYLASRNAAGDGDILFVGVDGSNATRVRGNNATDAIILSDLANSTTYAKFDGTTATIPTVLSSAKYHTFGTLTPAAPSSTLTSGWRQVWYDGGSGARYGCGVEAGSSWILGSAGVKLYVGSEAAPLQALTINAVGEIGINNTSPSSQFRTVSRSASVVGQIVDTAASPSVDIAQFRNNASDRFVIRNDGFWVDRNSLRLTADATRTSTATLTNLSDFTFTVAAGRHYEIELGLHYNAGATGGIKIDLNGGTATATNLVIEGYITDNVNNVTNSALRITALSGTHEFAGITEGFIYWKGCITVNAAGTLILRFAQSVSNGAATTALRGCIMKMRELTN